MFGRAMLIEGYEGSALRKELRFSMWFYVIRRDLVLAKFRIKFSLSKSFTNEFFTSIFVPVERANC